MMRWIRWSYLLPRLALVVLVILVVEFGAGPFLGWAVRTSGERAVGAKVEIGVTEASLLHGLVSVRDLRVANPRSPMKNLVEADLVELDFETSSLLRKSATARHGLVRGLRFGTPRESSGALPEVELPPEPAASSWWNQQAASMAEGLWDGFDTRFQEGLVDALESVRLSEELAARWPEKYKVLERQIRQLKQNAAALEQSVQEARANPLRHTDLWTRLPEEVAAFQESFRQLQVEIDGMPAAFEADRRAIIAARRHDEQLIRQQLHVDQIDAAAMTAYFLNDRVAGPLQEVISWIRWSRALVPSQESLAAPERIRGMNILFPGCRRLPDFLVRTLELEGSGRLAGQPVELRGVVKELTSEPMLHGRPTTLQLTTTGSMPLELLATLDRTGAVPRDQLQIDCQGWVIPSMRLGKPDQFGLSIAPTSGAVRIDVELTGERLKGQIQLVQSSVQMTPTVSPRLAQLHLDETLGDALRGLDRLTTDITLAGTLDQPEWELDSNLGPAVSTAMHEALTRTIQSQADALSARTQQQVDHRLAQLDRLVAEQQQALLPQLDGAEQLLEQAVGKLSGELGGLSLEKLGRKLPVKSLFR